MKPNFQIIIIIVFMVAAVLGVLVFSGTIPIGGDDDNAPKGRVVMWGTVPAATISEALNNFRAANESFTLTYEQKDAETFNQDLLEALASGTGPDIFFLPNDLAYHYSNKIFKIPYGSYPLNTFKNVFAGAGEVFLTEGGILAFPIAIDPLVMYYNRSMLDTSGVVYPPTTWNELLDVVPSLTKKDENNKIIKSAVALGHFSNVTHAKDIIAALFLQAGNPILTEVNGFFTPTLDRAIGSYNLPSILEFYTNFADPNNPAYSWNKSFPNSDVAFSREDLAFYFGYASELESLVNRNPNQNFFVTTMPQIKGSNSKVTGARVIGIAVSSASKNFNTAFTAANLLASTDFARAFAEALGVAPARRDLLAQKLQDAFSPIFYSSALFAKSWPDPSPEDTDDIWETMVGGVLSNSLSVSDAIRDASAKLNLLLIR